MFKDFWENEKHIIEATGILTAIGALFLNINLPENELARNALLNIQMLWLLIISIMSILLFVTFWSLAIKIENKIEKKISQKMYYNIFGISIGMTGIWFLQNLWKYLFGLYKQELSNFLSSLSYVAFGVGLLIVVYFANKYTNYYSENKKVKYFFSVLLVSFLAGLVYSFLAEAMDLNFSFSSFLGRLFMSFELAFLLCLLETYLGIKKLSKINKKIS